MFKEYNEAQKYFDQAYNLAAHRQNFHTGDIDTQQARLYLLRLLDEGTSEKIIEYFKKADEKLYKLPNNIYKLRQVMLYEKVYDKKYHLLGKKQKHEFVSACKRIKIAIERDVDLWLNKTFGDSVQDRCYKGLCRIVDAV